MRVMLRFTMPLGSILKGEGKYDPNTGEIVFCDHTDREMTRRLRLFSFGHDHIREAVAMIEGKELPLKKQDGRWFAHKLNFTRKLNPLRWEIPAPAPRWEIPYLREKLDQSFRHRQRRIALKGFLERWGT